MIYKRPGFEIEAGYGGAIAMMMVPDDIAEAIVEWAKKNIGDNELYGLDGKGRADSPHVTLQNGIMCEDATELERLFSGLTPMEAKLGPTKIFRQDDKDYDVVYVEVLCDAIKDANFMVSELLEVNNPHKEYNPHITLAYVKKGAGARFDGLNDFIGKDMVLDEMVIDGAGMDVRKMLLKKPEGREDKIPGGKADEMSESDFDSKALEEGAAHELEHTKNIEIAREIAMDHLAEDPDYYKKLKKVEANKKKKGCAHGKPGKWCGRCRPLKESMDYGIDAYAAEDLEDYLLSNGRSIKNMSEKERSRMVRDFKRAWEE